MKRRLLITLTLEVPDDVQVSRLVQAMVEGANEYASALIANPEADIEHVDVMPTMVGLTDATTY